jgi:4-aminobutyrate aminotransferase
MSIALKIGSNAAELIQRDNKVISPSYTRDYPFVMAYGHGSEVWDVDGERYIDFTSGIAVNATGHAHPEVVQAIKDQADKFIHMAGTDFYYRVQIELGEKLAEIAPFEEPARVFFCNSGTEAVEAAIKLARVATGRQQYIGFLRGFHGRTMGSLSFTASKRVQREGYFPTMPGVIHVPYPDPFRPILNMDGYTDYGDRIIDYLENLIFTTLVSPEEVAAVLVEPMQGEGGYVVPTPHFFPRLRQLCDKYGILLVVDEVQTGIGRTGKWWGIQHFGVEPDIVCSAKGIASGMPLGAIIARDSLMSQWVPGAHGNTFGGNPISCAAALATLRLIEGGMMHNAAEMGEYIMTALEEMMPRHPSMAQVRGKGLFIGVELSKGAKQSHAYAKELRDDFLHRAFDEKLLLLGCGPSAVRVIPALNVEKPLVDEALSIFDRALLSAEKAAGMA